MTAPDQLRALADRCEAAMENDRDLFEEAFLAVYPDILVGSPEEVLSDRFVELLDIGAFLDAAMTLVPESENHWPQLIYYGLNPNNPSVQKHRYQIWTKTCLKPSHSNSATPALALCAASLRARAASMGEG